MQYVMPLSQLLLYFSDISQKLLLVTYVEQLVPFYNFYVWESRQ